MNAHDSPAAHRGIDVNLVARCVFLLVVAVLTVSRGGITQDIDTKDEPRIAPEAYSVFDTMSKFLARSETFSVNAYASIDEVTDSGQKLQFAHARKLWVRRPNKMRGEAKGDLVNIKAWYNGKTLTIFDENEQVYMVREVPDTIDAMIDFMAEKEGVVVPLLDLALSDMKVALLERIQHGEYVGVGKVRDWKCHHLAFRQEQIDWQLWIEDGDTPVPRKLVITYKLLPGEPQYVAILDKWDFGPKFSKGSFEFAAPEGAEQIPYLSVELTAPETQETEETE